MRSSTRKPTMLSNLVSLWRLMECVKRDFELLCHDMLIYYFFEFIFTYIKNRAEHRVTFGKGRAVLVYIQVLITEYTVKEEESFFK